MIELFESYPFIVFALYLSIAAYTCYSTIKFQNIFYSRYPLEAKNLLGTEKYLGLNKKQGLLFLADYNIKKLIKNDASLVRARSKAVFLWCFFIFMMFGIVLVPMAVLIFGKIIL